MVVEEKQTKIAPSVSIRALTFEGAALGPMIVMHEGDYMVWEQRRDRGGAERLFQARARNKPRNRSEAPECDSEGFSALTGNPTYKGRKRSVRGQ